MRTRRELADEHPHLDVQVVEDWSAIRDEWKSLVAGDPNSSIFQTWEWISLQRDHGLITGKAKLLAVREGPELCGLVPLQSANRGFGHLRKFVLCGGDYLDVVADQQHAHAVGRAVLAYFADTRSRWDVIDLRSQRAGSVMLSLTDGPDPDHSEWRSNRNGLAMLLVPHQQYPYIALPKSWQLYEQALSSKFRRQLGSDGRKRDLEASTLVRRATAETLEEDMVALFKLHQARWTDRGHEGAFASLEAKAFHTELASALLAENKLRLYTMRMNDKPVAALQCFCHGDSVCYYQGGFNPDYSAYSPAKALIAQAVRDAISDGYAVFDFLKGEEDYKSKWNTQARPTYRLVLCPNRPLPLFAMQILKLQPRIKTRLRPR